jgi:MFS family permease
MITYSMAKANSQPQMTFNRFMSLMAMAFLWTGSQIPIYLFGEITSPVRWSLRLTRAGGIPPYIYADIGGTDRWVWFVLANLLALAAVCPFVGALSDLLGRRYVAIGGAGLIVLGMIVCSTAHTMNTFIGIGSFTTRFARPHC